jgi:threonine/homoserine/homoserine lactone efflux protein
VDALLLGLGIGLAAGISPGPLLVMVVAATLRSGWRAGALAACAPLVTDVLVVGGVLLVLNRLPERTLAVLGVVGGALVIASGVRTCRESRTAVLNPADARAPGQSLRALRQAAIVNLISPHPWVAWATALGPLTISTWRAGAGGAVALVAGFYATLIGAKVAIAALVAGGRHRLGVVGYRRALFGAGALLALAGAALIVEFAPQLR